MPDEKEEDEEDEIVLLNQPDASSTPTSKGTQAPDPFSPTTTTTTFTKGVGITKSITSLASATSPTAPAVVAPAPSTTGTHRKRNHASTKSHSSLPSISERRGLARARTDVESSDSGLISSESSAPPSISVSGISPVEQSLFSQLGRSLLPSDIDWIYLNSPIGMKVDLYHSLVTECAHCHQVVMKSWFVEHRRSVYCGASEQEEGEGQEEEV